MLEFEVTIARNQCYLTPKGSKAESAIYDPALRERDARQADYLDILE